ncbi:GDSL-type esterase/lipase family protein [uncultured Draconibacterium sp.]|uniref:GDSL-type esterase/lipase family protein n=1 Tax=uncultured Draconibacterium sp. TaxID=1573823 RepID=UPI002AA74B4B|nr:GDSL-type esterase/lipase family protein [uncultured Draconibacterium sp.]
MKRVIILVVIAVLNIAAFAQGQGGIDFSKAFIAGKERRADIFTIMATKTGCIEFVGGSIMEDCEWKELFDNPNIINRGIDGNTTDEVLGRTAELTRHKPTKVFLEIGTQDLNGGVGIDTVVNNISKIAKAFLAEKTDTRIYIFSVLPAAKADPNAPFRMPAASNDNVVAMNTKLKTLCEKSNLIYLDLYTKFLNKDKTALDAKLGTSNSKLSVAGYGLLGDLIYEYVNN